jgi:hypothetical protein
MTRTTLATIVGTALLTVSALAVAVVRNRPAGESGTSAFPEPLSYAKPSTCGRFVFVVFGNPKDEAALPEGEMKRKVLATRQTYPRPGLYAIDDATRPLWESDGLYAPDDNVYVPAGGESVVRIDGDWWKTKNYVAGQRDRLSADKEQAQLDAPAVSFLSKAGVRSYALKDVILDRARLPHSPDHIIWPGGAALNEKTGQFLLYTQDAHRVVFDARTGDVISRGEVGFGSRFAQNVVMVTIALTVVLAVGWAAYAWKRRKPPTAPAE